MYSVFFRMSEIITNILFGLFEKMMLKEKETFKEMSKYSLSLTDKGWIYTQQADRYFVEYRGNKLMFRPRIPVIHETESIKRIPVILGKSEPERIYISWKEAASDEFFKDVEALFKMVKKHQVGGTTKGG